MSPTWFMPVLLSLFLSAPTNAFHNLAPASVRQPFREGITLLSPSSQESFLLNGTADQQIVNYVFRPPPGIPPSQYTTSFQCDSPTVYRPDACVLTTADVTTPSDESALNATVRCAFEAFPGSTRCTLRAELLPATRFALPNETDMSTVARQAERFESPPVEFTVYGVVFYLPDKEGRLSENATIVSGDSLAYRLQNFDRVTQPVREVSTFAFGPGVRATGTRGLDFFSAATLTLDFEDFLFRYEPSCEIADAGFDNGDLTLPQPESCGVGLAVKNETAHPTLGVAVRPYKSGRVTIHFFWPIFGTSAEPVEQVLIIDVAEPAPPVITTVEKLEIYKSIPCDVEILRVVGYNMRFADTRQLVVFSQDKQSSQIWSEAVDGFRYDEATDTSVVTFENGGGSGQGVSFGMRTFFNGQVRNAVTLAEIDLTLTFTMPILLTRLNQTVVGVDGGDILEVTGDLEEFGVEDTVFIGSFQIPAGDLIIFDSERLVFFSPPLADLGSSFEYPIAVGVCAERSNSLTLQYQAAPIVFISSSDSSRDDSEIYFIKADEGTTFIAEVTGNNIGVSFEWKLFNAASENVDTGNATTTSQVFIVQPELLASTNERHILEVTVTNSLGLSDTESTQITRTASQQDYVLVNVHEIDSTIQRSVDAPTMVHAHITTKTTLDPTVVLQWTYQDMTYLVDEQFFESEEEGEVTSNQTTGPSKLGLEFFILKEDLVVGSQDISLTATLAADPSVKGNDTITLVVVASPIQAVINEGINGTLLLSGTDLNLSGSRSLDPDILPGEGDPAAGLTYEWLNCRRSLASSFTTDVSDCSTIVPADKTSENITIVSSDLLSSQLETGSSPPSTYLSFGLRVRKDKRVSEAYIYFELRTVSEPQKMPTLTSLEIVDRRGNVLPRNGLSIFGDVIIQPASDDALVSWAYDMSLRNQRFLFSQFGTLRNGTGFISDRGVASRLPLGFNPGVLEANTEYRIELTVSASDTPLTSTSELSFRTAEVPKLTCTPPEVTTGVIQETRFTVSATLSFETQGLEYCFFLTTETESFILGQGCSTVPFVTFKFYRAGSYSLSCVAKTSIGHMVDIVTLPSAVTLTDPITESEPLTALGERLGLLEEEIARCEAQRDEGCLISLIFVGKDIASEIEEITTDTANPSSNALRERTRTYITKLADVSNTLAKKTVFRANEIPSAVDLSYNLALVPAAFITDEETLLAALKPAEVAINATKRLPPVVSERLVTRMGIVANRTITTAYRLSTFASTRTRSNTGGNETPVLGEVLMRVPGLLVSSQAQQVGCDFSGALSTTRTPDATGVSVDDGLPSLVIGLRVSCDGSIADVGAGNMSARVCTQAGRAVVSVTEVPGVLLRALGRGSGEAEAEPVLLDVGALVGGDGGVDEGEGCVVVEIDAGAEEGERFVRRMGRGGRGLDAVDEEDGEVVVVGGVVTIRSSATGLFVVGRGLGSINGLTVSGVLIACVAVGVGLLAGGAMLLGRSMARETSDDGVVDWEYIERDLWGRDLLGKHERREQVAHLNDL